MLYINMLSQYFEKPNIKYTRGEYCISAHIWITFALLLIIVFIFVTHLYLIEHNNRNVIKLTAASTKIILQSESAQYYPVGVLYIDSEIPELVCNAVLLKRGWSVAPASFVAMQTDETMAALIPHWRISYANNYSGYDETRIRRAIPHPGFRRSDFRYNIGLLEHTMVVLDESFEYVFSKYIPITDGVLHKYSAAMSIITTTDLFEAEEDWNSTMVKHLVTPILRKKCEDILEEIVNMRNYEFCVTFSYPKEVAINYGAALVVDSKIEGFFAWGDKESSDIPFVILHIPFFRDWLEAVVYLDYVIGFPNEHYIEGQYEGTLNINEANLSFFKTR